MMPSAPINVDYISGMLEEVPTCSKCGDTIRPNIQLRNDLDFVEEPNNTDIRRFEEFLRNNKRKQFVVLEIGAGPVQPIAREMAKLKLLNDKYKTTLIRINPIKERNE